MYSIVDCQSIRENENFKVSVTINNSMNTLDVDCQLPINRRVTFNLSSRGQHERFDRKMFKGGEHVQIPLQHQKADSITFQVSDENGLTVVIYRIIKSFS